ncbi:MAG: hypothetical protein U9Q98_11965 [Bacteroidota bacterium]|nr:hypothetical protein [Bacteroidota bacterium]
MKHTFFNNFSVPKVNNDIKKTFEATTTQIINKKEQDEDTSTEEQQIDIMVYKLYDLIYDEVKLIDPEFPLSKEAYEKFMVE